MRGSQGSVDWSARKETLSRRQEGKKLAKEKRGERAPRGGKTCSSIAGKKPLPSAVGCPEKETSGKRRELHRIEIRYVKKIPLPQKTKGGNFSREREGGPLFLGGKKI